VLKLVAFGCVDDSDEPLENRVAGVWSVGDAGALGWAMTVSFTPPSIFGGEGAILVLREWSVTNAQSAFTLSKGTYFFSGEHLHNHLMESTCHASPVFETLDIEVVGKNRLRVTSDTSEYEMRRVSSEAVSQPSGSDLGCFDDAGVFTPQVIKSLY
jgi:hypothetical protein